MVGVVSLFLQGFSEFFPVIQASRGNVSVWNGHVGGSKSREGFGNQSGLPLLKTTKFSLKITSRLYLVQGPEFHSPIPKPFSDVLASPFSNTRPCTCDRSFASWKASSWALMLRVYGGKLTREPGGSLTLCISVHSAPGY